MARSSRCLIFWKTPTPRAVWRRLPLSPSRPEAALRAESVRWTAPRCVQPARLAAALQAAFMRAGAPSPELCAPTGCTLLLTERPQRRVRFVRLRAPEGGDAIWLAILKL